MPGLAAYRTRLEALLSETAAAHGVPGAVCGVLLEGDTAIAAHGVANIATGVEVTPDTLFQIGSITKLYTTTLVLQAHAAGLLALDEPVRAQLQEFSVADPGATLEITPRHLLTHTSGIAGDHLLDTGSNPDALLHYVATLAGLGQVHAPDEAYSFCNTGFGVVGRLIEVVCGENFDQALRRRLLRPLGCSATLTLPQHLLLRRTAAGHIQVPGGEPSRQPRWTLTRANGPMGGIVCTAADLLAFARMHIESGQGSDRHEVLPAAAVELMTESQIETPIPGEEQALGWSRRHWGDEVCLGQDADTFGQRAFLRVVPACGFALTVQANSPLGAALARDLVAQVAADLLDVRAEEPLRVPASEGSTDGPAAGAVDPAPLVGTYDRLHQRVVVAEVDGGLTLTTEPSGVLAALGARRAVAALRPVDVDRGVFVLTDPASGTDQAAVFGQGHDQAPSLHVDGRVHRRLS
ncbi:MAG TPA: serine hydrolase domain-containing protein [Acidimicrobiales bacterium]|nr:serine hydrolase domain-containing protein [Acidimicrobiales bacterium]